MTFERSKKILFDKIFLISFVLKHILFKKYFSEISKKGFSISVRRNKLNVIT